MLSRSCIEKTRRIGTLLNIAIFCITFGDTGLLARQAIMWGWMPASISRLMPSCAALLFCSPSALGSMMYVSATKQHEPGPFFKGQLTQRFDVEPVLVVAHRAADFDEDHIGGRLPSPRTASSRSLRFTSPVTCGIICTSRPEVRALALALEDLAEDLPAGREVAPLRFWSSIRS
jgi:hypothetical protein